MKWNETKRNRKRQPWLRTPTDASKQVFFKLINNDNEKKKKKKNRRILKEKRRSFAEKRERERERYTKVVAADEVIRMKIVGMQSLGFWVGKIKAFKKEEDNKARSPFLNRLLRKIGKRIFKSSSAFCLLLLGFRLNRMIDYLREVSANARLKICVTQNKKKKKHLTG